MRNISLSAAFATLFSVVIITFCTPGSIYAYPSGSPAGYTGSPGDGQHCVSCHGGSAATVSGWITTNIPATGYVAGTIYTITATVSGSGKKGMEVSPQGPTGTQLGILAAGSNSHLVGGTKYVTQNSSGSTSSTVVYNFSWTAPAAGTGDVTFYGAFTVGKSNTKLSTTVVSEDVSLPLSATATATPSVICEGQSVQLNVVASGGSGSFTYSWSSVPAGFSSTLQNPVVSPAVNTEYIAHVSDGAQTVDAGVDVAVTLPTTAAAGSDSTYPYLTTQVPLNGNASNYSAVNWTSTGSGSFSSASTLNGFYLPSADDKNAGSVTLTLTASPQAPCLNAATDQCVIHFDFPIGISENRSNPANLLVAPNPTNGQFTVSLQNRNCQQATILIQDVCGKTVASQRLDIHSPKAAFDLTNHPKGVYLIHGFADEQSVIQKIIVK